MKIGNSGEEQLLQWKKCTQHVLFCCYSNVLIPGSTREVAKQFLRCVLIKLAPNGIFSELFRSTLKGEYWHLAGTSLYSLLPGLLLLKKYRQPLLVVTELCLIRFIYRRHSSKGRRHLFERFFVIWPDVTDSLLARGTLDIKVLITSTPLKLRYFHWVELLRTYCSSPGRLGATCFRLPIGV